MATKVQEHVKHVAENRTDDELSHHLLSPGTIPPLAPRAVALSPGAIVSTATSVTLLLAARANGTRVAERHERTRAAVHDGARRSVDR